MDLFASVVVLLTAMTLAAYVEARNFPHKHTLKWPILVWGGIIAGILFWAYVNTIWN